mgnify:CR=1 FL=1
MQHSNNGAVLASTGGAGRGRRVPSPSPALVLNYTNSPAPTPLRSQRALVVAEPAESPEGPGGGDWGARARKQRGARRICKCTSPCALDLTHAD